MVLNRQTGSFVAGVLLMGLGGLFLIAQLLGGHFWAYFWPYPIIATGLAFFYAMLATQRGGFAIPGSIITTIGVLLLLQNSFGWWESWAFAWTLIVVAVGVGITLMGMMNHATRATRNGLRIAALGMGLFFVFGTYFGMGFSFLGFGFATRVFWPLMLIGGGALLALRSVVNLSQHSLKEDRPVSIPDTNFAPANEAAPQSVTM
jgi:hypothetical protein